MNDEYVKKLYNEIRENLDGDYKIILEPNRELTEEWIEYDQVKWDIDEPIQDLVEKLLKNNNLSFEEKVLKIYEFICLNYIYDDNVLYFFRTDMSDMDNIKYIAVDWYGRVIDAQWKENRKKHNRRVCYEFARFYAKAINQLLNKNDEVEAVMVGLKDNTHYVVGLTGKEYSAILDLDDFNNIKDLTRLKMGLTIEGIKILRDDSGKFQNILDNFNKGRLKELREIEDVRRDFRNKNIIEYFNYVVEILNSYNIDSQGFCEYMKSIIENEEIKTEKIWREVKGKIEKRYTKCLIFEYNCKNYLIDSLEKVLREIDKGKINNDYILKPEENEYQYYGG